MKQKDMALILVIVVISAVISIIISKTFITSPKNRQQKVEVVEPITANFSTPDKKYFNDQSIDPTKLIKIGENSNKNPFNN